MTLISKPHLSLWIRELICAISKHREYLFLTSLILLPHTVNSFILSHVPHF